MKLELDRLVADSQDRMLPDLIRRHVIAPRAPGNALAVIGMRRTGKTWFCYQQMQDLMSEGVARERMLYMNFEDERLLAFSANDFQPLLDAFYRRNPAVIDTECHFFFDEIQEVEGWPHFIRRLLDQGNAQITITGSSARLLSAEIHTSLRGRALPCEIFPFSFSEYIAAVGGEHPSRVPSSKERLMVEATCLSYMLTGGFPGVVSLDASTQRQMLQQYLDVVILRDVIERHGVTSVPALRALVRHVIHAPATRLSINKIYNDFRSRGLSCSKNSLHAFMDHLADAYLLYQVPIHTRSERIRRANPQKVYLVDTGLLSAASADTTSDRGAMLENLVFLHLRRTGAIIEYFHASKGIETDFVVRDPMSGAITELIQVCWSLESPATLQRELRGLRAAMADLGCPHGTIVSWQEESALVADEDISVIPAWRFVLG
jgi:predicted AAA+ superfamily ATPase